MRRHRRRIILPRVRGRRILGRGKARGRVIGVRVVHRLMHRLMHHHHRVGRVCRRHGHRLRRRGGRMIPPRVGHDHRAGLRRRVGGRRRGRDGGGRGRVSHQVDFALAVGRPEVDGEHEKAGVNLTAMPGLPIRQPFSLPFTPGFPLSPHLLPREHLPDIDFLIRDRVSHEESNAWRRRDGPSILDARDQSLVSPVGLFPRTRSHPDPPCHQSHTFAPAPVVATLASCHQSPISHGHGHLMPALTRMLFHAPSRWSRSR